MNREEITRKLSSHFTNLKEISKAIRAQGDDEAIHQFRVQVKQLRAFLRLLSYGPCKRKTIKLSNRFKRLYHRLGDSRSLLVVSDLIYRHALADPRLLPVNYLKNIRKTALQQKMELASVNFRKIIRKEYQRVANIVPELLGENGISRFSEDQSTILKATARKPFISNEQFHGARKALKDISYNFDYFSAGQRQSLILKSKSAIKKLTSVLGDFQDINATIEVLNNSFRKTAGYQQEEPIIKRLVKILTAESEVFRKSLSRLRIFNTPPEITRLRIPA